MDPLITGALIGAGGSLIQGLTSKSDKQKAQDQAAVQWDLYNKKKQSGLRTADERLKPTIGPRYDRSQGMNIFDEMIKNRLFGKMQERDKKAGKDYGIDYKRLVGQLGNVDFSAPRYETPAPPVTNIPGAPGRPPAQQVPLTGQEDPQFVNNILSKYGVT